MRSLARALGLGLRRAVPPALKAKLPVSVKARVRTLLGLEPWPDLAVRHPLFRGSRYRAMRRAATPFDAYRKPYKPVIERGHQTSFVAADWFARAGVKSVFHVGYASGRYVFYFLQAGIDAGGTELAPEDTPDIEVPLGLFPASARERLARQDFFDLTPARVSEIWGDPDAFPLGVLFTEATFETLMPWRIKGFTIAKYGEAAVEMRETILRQQLPDTLARLQSCFRNMIFIEPEPGAGGAGLVFDACAKGLPGFEYSVWTFQPPLDRVFRLSPSQPTRQAIYAYTKDPALLTALGEYAVRVKPAADAPTPTAWPEPLRRGLAEYYTRYYRDTLGIPGWRELVAVRLSEESYEAAHLVRLEAALGRPVAGLRLLNVGCGTGGFTVIARRAGARAVGVDAEPAAVEICRLKASLEGGGAVALGAVEALPFGDGTFDLVYCFSTLEHVESVPAAVREMLRVARPGGAVYVNAPNALACYEGHYKLFWLPLMPKPLARLYLRARKRPTGFVDTFQPLLRGRLESLFRAAGARVSRLEADGARLPETGSPLWPLVRVYYRLVGVSPHIELLAWK